MIGGSKNVVLRDCLPDSTPEDKGAEQSNLVDQKVRSGDGMGRLERSPGSIVVFLV
jgi:hypothetical protein